MVVNGRAGPLNDLQAEFLGSANQAARRASRMVDDFVFIMQGGRSPDIRPAPVSLLDRVHACCWELSHIEGHQDLHVVTKSEEDPTMISGDTDRIDQILLNLLENACRHGASDRPVEVVVRRDGSDVLFSVTNAIENLNGLDPASWFVPFYRGDDVKTSGLGLGMSVANWLVQAHGGSIFVDLGETAVTVEARFPGLTDE